MEQNQEQPEMLEQAEQVAKPTKRLNKKRVIIASIAAIVFVALVVIGASLLFHEEKSMNGTLNGTVGASSIPVPEDIDGLTFGIAYSRVCLDSEEASGYSSAGYFSLTDGKEVTFYEPTETESVTLNIVRYSSDSSFSANYMGEGVVVYSTELPASMTWNLADALTKVEWEDGLFDGHDVEVTYSCTYNDNCNGQFYITQVNVYCPEGINSQHYWVYQADFDLVTTT